MNDFAKRQQARQDRMSPEEILRQAKARGRFSVSLRYRDEWLARRCRKLKARGLLVGGRREGGDLVFYPAAESRDPQPEREATC